MITLLAGTESTGAAEHANQVVEAATGAIGVGWLIPVVPLLGFVLMLLLSRAQREQGAFVAIGASTASFVLSVLVFLQVRDEPATYVLSLVDFLAVGSLQVEWGLLVDQLTAVMLLVVTGVGTLVHVYSYGYMHGDARFGTFFAYLNLFLFSMLVLVLGSSFVTLFVGWELVGLSSYLLIGFWFENAEYASAAKKAFITNRVGDVAFMVGMFVIFATDGTLDFFTVDGTGVLQSTAGLATGTAFAIGLLLLGGAAAKSAQIPLYVWLPDAMAGPTPVSALIHAATMVTAGVYLTVRASAIYVQSLDAMMVVAWIGAATALLGALIAIRQDDIKKILAYSTVSQLGYMFIGVGVGGFAEGVFHLTTQAFFKGLLFLAAGSVMHAMANRTDAWQMGGLRKVMPITFWTSAVAWLAISGVPPFAGFFSKDQILTVAYDRGFTAIWAVGLLTGILTAFYMSRWFFLIFLGEPRWRQVERVVDRHGGGAGAHMPAEGAARAAPSSHDAHVSTLHPRESPPSITVPLVVLAVLSAAGGAVLNFTHDGPLFRWLQPAVASIEGVAFARPGPLTEPMLIVISTTAALAGIGLAWLAYGPRRDLSMGRLAEPIRGPIAELIQRKFFVDELYQVVFVRVGGRLSAAAAAFDRRVVDSLVNGTAAGVQSTARSMRRVQTGLVRGYLAAMVAGLVVLLAALLTQVR
ncbi:MAG: NADH-quinone oxidoreductase subunit L [Actinomycetes bacterium]